MHLVANTNVIVEKSSFVAFQNAVDELKPSYGGAQKLEGFKVERKSAI